MSFSPSLLGPPSRADRLNPVHGNSTRVEKSLEELDAKMETKKMELVHLQTQIQQKRETEQQALGGAVPGAKAAV